jgi:Protein of unknown function (DUF2652)
MTAIRETGTLLLADLTGYTAYLSRSELEQGPTIAGDLLETVVGRLEPPFRLAKLEGDAAFMFVEDGRADASLQLDAIEAAYVAFKRRLRSIDAATTCDCAACRLAPRLDLKMFIHHGEFVRNRIAGHDELAGTDVILAHRLLKGSAAEQRSAGFAQFTAAAAEWLGLADRDDLPGQTESFDHVGATETYIVDLEARWRDETDRRRLDIAPGGTVLDVELTLPADPATCWAFLTSPALRGRWEGGSSSRTPRPAVGEVSGRRWSASPVGSRHSRRSSTGSRSSTSPGGSGSRASARSMRPRTSRRSTAEHGSSTAGRPRPRRPPRPARLPKRPRPGSRPSQGSSRC